MLHPFNQSITTSTASTIAPFTPGSYAMVYVPQGVFSVAVGIDGAWAGTVVGFYSPDNLNFFPIANSAFFLASNQAATGINSGAVGQYTLPISGPCYLYIVASSYFSGPINVNLGQGSGYVGSASV